jgi:hypothetical protein
LDGNNAELGQVGLRGYNRQLVDALQPTKVTLGLSIDVSDLVFNDTGKEEHFTTFLSTVSTLKEVAFSGGVSVFSRTLSPERVLRLVKTVWSNPCISSLQIFFRVPFQLGGLFRIPSSIPNIELHLFDYDQDEFVNGWAQNAFVVLFKAIQWP